MKRRGELSLSVVFQEDFNSLYSPNLMNIYSRCLTTSIIMIIYTKSRE